VAEGGEGVTSRVTSQTVRVRLEQVCWGRAFISE
jgi:hypothetical protein